MAEKYNQDTMSQGDILDSIRKMVENDKNASVLELTDLLDENGNITKITKEKVSKKNTQKETDVGDFLRLIKDNKSISGKGSHIKTDNFIDERETNMDEDNNATSNSITSNNDYIHRIVDKTVKDYLDANLPAIAKKIIENVVVNMLRKM